MIPTPSPLVGLVALALVLLAAVTTGLSVLNGLAAFIIGYVAFSAYAEFKGRRASHTAHSRV